MMQWMKEFIAKVKPQKFYQLLDLSDPKPEPTLVQVIAKKKGCADCGGALLEGPSGGMCTNVKCEDCGSKFNISIFNGDLLYAERIE